MTLSFQDNLDAARRKIDHSRQASERAKDFIDAGYIKRQERDLAVEELRLGVEHLVEALALLETRITNLEKVPTIFRRRR